MTEWVQEGHFTVVKQRYMMFPLPIISTCLREVKSSVYTPHWYDLCKVWFPTQNHWSYCDTPEDLLLAAKVAPHYGTPLFPHRGTIAVTAHDVIWLMGSHADKPMSVTLKPLSSLAPSKDTKSIRQWTVLCDIQRWPVKEPYFCPKS